MILRLINYVFAYLLLIEGYPPVFYPFALRMRHLIWHALILFLVLALADAGSQGTDRLEVVLVLLLRIGMVLFVLQEGLLGLVCHQLVRAPTLPVCAHNGTNSRVVQVKLNADFLNTQLVVRVQVKDVDALGMAQHFTVVTLLSVFTLLLNQFSLFHDPTDRDVLTVNYL